MIWRLKPVNLSRLLCQTVLNVVPPFARYCSLLSGKLLIVDHHQVLITERVWCTNCRVSQTEKSPVFKNAAEHEKHEKMTCAPYNQKAYFQACMNFPKTSIFAKAKNTTNRWYYNYAKDCNHQLHHKEYSGSRFSPKQKWIRGFKFGLQMQLYVSRM